MPRRKTGSYEAGRQRRARIITAAAEHFAGLGYHRTSLTQVAEAADVTEGGLLHHFPSKKHLLLAVAEHRIEATAAWWGELPEDAGLTQVLDLMVRTTERFLAEPGLIQLNVLATAEAADPSSPAHEALSRRYRTVIEHLAATLQRCADRGELAGGTDCAALARECIAVSDGLQLQWVLTDGETDLVGGVRAHCRRILGGA
ncbi:TetR/AcrR family transcriptional regulator [Paractinoplanes atraurantiacus]|uniref:DNA-binding transcriptional regulator, AcrR family n=1 Tax=Paractinoplanes atraurantiacus TaxID=1036182 RepID=A0A285I4T8_9ACTN|nr:TetR/AcrR family transcriptional regulator [Actinoplanes atraurantiacus]SNY43032.1 DNA-binding transcriptional regulator, AcrR family [Actinoplanes atraurantiacus]